jgi:predicted enzyme related to lactoylglutathione lyase
MTNDWARPVVHFEIEVTDSVAQRRFYAELFHWTIGDPPIMTIPAGIGGPENGVGGHMRQGRQPGVHLYIQVRDLAESLARVGELGGRVVTEPFQIPGGPTLAAVADPEGIALMLVQQ